jgi:uncharacterized protein with PhoU and TrkA domain
MNERRTVKDLLADAKDHSELMVDLAHAAIFFGDDDIAAEVVRLREDMSRIVVELQEISILAARSPEDAEAMASVLQMAAAMDKIADAAEDIARVCRRSCVTTFAMPRRSSHACASAMRTTSKVRRSERRSCRPKPGCG